MKVINILGFLLLVVLLGCQEDEGLQFGDENLQFVRFSLILDKDSTLIKDITTNTATEEVASYFHASLDTIFIPVAMSTPGREKGVTIRYRAEDNLGLKGDLYDLNPADTLYFDTNDWIKYIKVVFNRPWTNQEKVTLNLKLESIDDASINLGYPRAFMPLDSIQIQFGGSSILKTYELRQTIYRYEQGLPDSLDVTVDFPNGLSQEELGLNPQFIALEKSPVLGADTEIDYSINLLPYTSSDTYLTYRIYFHTKVNAAQSIFLRLKLLENINPLYNPGTIKQGVITQVPIMQRIDLDAAADWTDPQNPVHRLFGEAWYLNNNDQNCRWQRFATNTQPFLVETGSTYDNGMGHHKFKVTFKGAVVGTNPFNIRRYYGGTSVESPGFNLKEGFELFPENATSGNVRVPPINLELIIRSNDAVVHIPAFGEGTYFYNESLEAYEMQLTMRYDETEIGGANLVEHQIRIFNRDIDVELDPLNEPCVPYQDL